MTKIAKLNVLIIGAGHYSTGSTVLEEQRATDKDMGVFLPSIVELKKQGLIDRILIVSRDGTKLPKLRKKVAYIQRVFQTNYEIDFFPKNNKIQDYAYLEALHLLPKPGAVLIATPDYLHKPMILDALKNNLHFMVAKPAVIKLKDLKAIINLLEKHKVLGLVDYHKVYDEANLLLKDEYLKGKYGEIQHIFTKMTQRRDMITIFKNWVGRYENNVNHYLGSHYIHLVSFITGAKPLTVRATAQYGIAKEDYGVNTPDLIETQIEWQTTNGHRFVSYHIAGWSDPIETASMTYQELHIIATKGHIESDQRYRGYHATLAGIGQEIINPYFFRIHQGINGNIDLETMYGFKSIKTFIKSAINIENGKSVKNFEEYLPSIRESLIVTSILEAADESLRQKSAIINVKI